MKDELSQTFVKEEYPYLKMIIFSMDFLLKKSCAAVDSVGLFDANCDKGKCRKVFSSSKLFDTVRLMTGCVPLCCSNRGRTRSRN